MNLRLLVGSDAAGLQYKDLIRADLEAHATVLSVVDIGMHADAPRTYPNVAIEAATRIANGEADRAVLVCGTGLGVAIAANKVPGVRAVTAHDSFSVERAVRSNNAQILCLGQRVIGAELARRLVGEWVRYEFDPASHSQANVAEICAFEGI